MDPRTSHTSRAEVAVLLAKGKLTGCLTTGPSKRSALDPSDINKFHHLLQVTISVGTHLSKEFKKCIAWIVCHVAKSRRRVAALGDYLVKIAESFDSHAGEQLGTQSTLLHAQTSINLLHLVDAIFARIHKNPANLVRKPLETYIMFAKAIEPAVARLVELAAPIRGLQAIHLHRALASILGHWSRNCLFTNRVRLIFRNLARKAYTQWLDWLQETYSTYHDKLVTKSNPENLQAELPNIHGSPEDAWYDLPVGAMIQAMKHTKPGYPLKTARLKPLSMPRGPVDPDMLSTVLDHVEECKGIIAIPNVPAGEGKEEIGQVTLNGLGLRLSQTLASGSSKRKFSVKEGYYGLSVPFMRAFEAVDKNPPAGPEKPVNWMPPPPPDIVPPPPFQANFPPNLPPPPPVRDALYGGSGGGYRHNDYGRGNGGAWRGGENRGGGGGGWRGRGRGGGGGGRGWGGGYRPY